MRWLLSAFEALAQWRTERHQKAADRWLRLSRWLRRRQEKGKQRDLFGEDGW